MVQIDPPSFPVAPVVKSYMLLFPKPANVPPFFRNLAAFSPFVDWTFSTPGCGPRADQPLFFPLGPRRRFVPGIPPAFFLLSPARNDFPLRSPCPYGQCRFRKTSSPLSYSACHDPSTVCQFPRSSRLSGPTSFCDVRFRLLNLGAPKRRVCFLPLFFPFFPRLSHCTKSSRFVFSIEPDRFSSLSDRFSGGVS